VNADTQFGAGESERDAVEATVYRIVAEALEIQSTTVTSDLRQEQIESWDSLRHLMLVSALEDGLGIRFSMEDVGAMTSVGEIVTRARARS
jgi:acyl carrier protein